jgi:hypothetical protein
MVSVKAAPLALVKAGDMLLSTGTGFDGFVTTSVTEAVAVV